MLDKPVTVLGRNTACDMRLGSASVAKFHCVLVSDRGCLTFRDLSGSRVEVNGQLAQMGGLADGDELWVGKFGFRVSGPTDTAGNDRPEPVEAALIAVAPNAEENTIPLGQEVTLIGRASDCDLCVEGDGIGEQHCILARTSRGVFLRHLERTSATFVNGLETAISVLDDGDEIAIGPLTFRMRASKVTELPASESSEAVLIVEPDDAIVKQLYRMLTTKGYSVRRAKSAEECMTQLESDEVDLVLIETDLPDRPGVDLCRAIRSDPRRDDIPIMFMTSDAMSDVDLADGFEAGACDFIAKPLGKTDVLARVGSRLREKQARDRYRDLARVDRFTGLTNRQSLEEQLTQMVSLARRRRRAIGLIIAELDHFKECTDAHGRGFGDQALRAFSGVLREGCRNEDIAARFSGHGFALALPETALDGAEKVADRLRTLWEQNVLDDDGQPVVLKLSLGVASLTEADAEDMTAELLLSQAEAALDAAKRRGGDCTVATAHVAEREE